MIRNIQTLERVKVDAALFPLIIDAGEGTFPGSRFKSVIDAKGYECGAVTDQYRLVRNADLLAAVDLAADKLGVELEAASGRYVRGRSRYRFYLPDTYKVPGDPSEIRMQFDIGNSYGGTNAVTGAVGAYRLVCTNGLVIGKVIAKSKRKHTQNLNIGEYVEDLIGAVVARAEAYKLEAEVLAQTAFEYKIDEAMDEAVKADRAKGEALLLAIAEDTPDKYHRHLKRAIRTNREDVGPTVWALLQAISEVATHDMKDSWARDDWQVRQVQRVHQFAGVK